MTNSSSNFWATLIIGLLTVLFLFYKQCKKNQTTANTKYKKENTSQKSSGGLDRNPSAINYSKHAKCRMDCRHIDESEVREILQNGKINYRKSEIKTDCGSKYAVEGLTHDQQRVRIIFAPCQTEVTVVTVIDLGTEWSCACD